MHVHVASVQPSLMAVLTQVATHKDTSWVYISCPATQATDCKCALEPSIMEGLLKPHPIISATRRCCSTVTGSIGSLL